MIKIGKKERAWNSVRIKLKKNFARLDITSCEVKLPGCWRTNALSFAHLDKRRFLSPEELSEVVLACIPCHQIIERWPREKMREFLGKIIQERQ